MTPASAARQALFAGARSNRHFASDARPRRLVRYLCDEEDVLKYAMQFLGDREGVCVEGDIFDPPSLTELNRTVKIRREQIRSPIDPPIILGTGLNYKRHAAECGLAIPEVPILAFFKQPTAVQHPFLPIKIPACCDPTRPEVDWEVELAIIIGKQCKDVSTDDAMKHVLGYTVANDVSARLWQTDIARTGGQWNKGKGFDTFCPLGPALVLQENGFDPHCLGLSLSVNGETMQSSNTSDFVFSIGEVVSFLSKGTTLMPGTVILTGTPEGVGMFQKPNPIYLKPGDYVSAFIDGIGTLENSVE
jgi:2-keto-4-pentenoate hydratase/2-oxohepta-3-ene-1,7-dioic acid hydratase in catechol pathway